MIKKIRLKATAIFLVVLMISGMVPGFNGLVLKASASSTPGDPSGNWIDGISSVDSTFGGGNGGQNNPYLISNALQLAQLAYNVNSGTTYITKYFKLTTSLDLSEHYWTPIGAEINSFQGKFDGNGKIISNMSIGSVASPINANGVYGLFGATGYTDGFIKNLGVTNISITAADAANLIGGLVGSNTYNSIENCYTTGTITAGTHGQTNVGGIVGANTAGSLLNCYSSVNITTSGSSRAGGLVGRNYPLGIANGVSSITNCYATGNVSTGTMGGGLVGMNYTDLAGKTASITNCYATGNVSAASYTGGLVGYLGGTAGNSVLTTSYWNNNATQTLDGSGQAGKGVGYGTDTSTSVTNDKMTAATAVSDTLVDILNTNKSGTNPTWYTWKQAAGVNDGYPTLMISAYGLTVAIAPGTANSSTKATITEAATSKFIVNVTSSSVPTPYVGDTAPAAGTNFIDNYTSGSDITTGVAENNFIQIYDVDGSGKVAYFYQKQLAAGDIKAAPADSTAPSLTAGTVSRTSDTACTVKFTSDEAGTYYYKIVTDGADAPDINTANTATYDGTAATAVANSETTITNPVNLTVGLKDIYVVVKDAAGNVSSAIKLDIDVASVVPAGAGTYEDPYRIATPENLVWMSANVASFTNQNYFKQTADIVWPSHVEFKPIGTQTNQFPGSYNGRYRKIKGLYIHGDYEATGLFGWNSTARISNLTLEDVSIAATGQFTGGIAAYGGDISNCHITQSSGGNSTISSTFAGYDGRIGGIISMGGTVEYCSNAAAITFVSSYGGGIAGASFAYSVSNCFNTGAVTGGAGTVSGGIVGYFTANGCSVDHCVNTGTITGAQKGGIVGNKAGGSLTANFYLSTTAPTGNGTDNTGAASETAAQLKSSDILSGWNTTTGSIFWTTDTHGVINSGYPYIIKESIAPIVTAGAVNRSNATQATVTFTPNEAGTYYYKIVDDGANAPVINPSDSSTYDGCDDTQDAGDETTITDPAGLTSGAKDIYIVVEDAAINLSDSIKLDIPISIDPVAPTGSGTQADPYQVSSVGNLLWISQNNSAQSGFENKYFKQTTDIDLIGLAEFVPIGDDSDSFLGVYDGNHKKISNLTIHSSYTTAGLFGIIGDEGTVKNLTLEDVSIEGQGDYAGSIAGISSGTVSNCHIIKSQNGTSTLTSSVNGNTLGSIVGMNGGIIEYCSNAATITQSGLNASIGGIVGSQFSESTLATISNCSNTGVVTGTSDSTTGGIAGGIVGGTIQYCLNIGTVSTDNPNYVGGVAGVSGPNSTFTCNFWVNSSAGIGIGTDMSSNNSSNALNAVSKTALQLKSAATYTGWNFSVGPLKWVINSQVNNGYPYIVYQNVLPNNLKVTENNGAINLDDDNIYLTLDTSKDWLQSIAGIVISKDGGTNTEGVDKWTLESSKIEPYLPAYKSNPTAYQARVAAGVYAFYNTQDTYNDLSIVRAMGNAVDISRTGTYTIAITAAGYETADLTFHITFGQLTGIKVIDQPSNVTSGGTVGTVQVALVDLYDNIYTATNGMTLSAVTASAKNSAFSAGGTLTASIVNGVADFNNITATKAEGLTGAKLHFTITRTLPQGGMGLMNNREPVLLAYEGDDLWQFMPQILFASNSGSGNTETYSCDSDAFNIAVQASGNENNNHDSGNTTTPAKPDNKTDIVVDGKKQEDAATSTTTTGSNGSTTTVVTIDDKKLEQILDKLAGDNTGAQSGTVGQAPVITIPVVGNSDKIVGELTGQTVKAMEAKDAVLEIKTETVTYTLPASEINIGDISNQIGQQVALKDIKVSVTIAEAPEDTVKFVEDTANKNNYQLVVKPVEFEITCKSGEKTVEVSRFNGYVERTVAIPDGIDPGRITTGIVLNSDGTFSHVPTTIIMVNGKYYAKINSLTNSTYSVIWSPKTFKDVENHWAKAAINDMGSRLVISGDGEDMFAPERDISRAEFASIIVRALGLMRPKTGKNSFSDVAKSDWYYDAISIAYEYGIIFGNVNGKFAPNDKITREQAMTMVARAMNITGLKVEFSTGEMDKLLASFSDAAKLSNYTKNSIAACIKTGIVTGRNGILIAPKNNITRAEVAFIIQRLLQKSGLI